jgi:DNA replication ATP-dependent helicase Dna2
MPSFSKKVLSLYLRTRCQKQLHLYLYNDKERETHGMPPRQTIRAGLGSAGKAGYEWQDEKVHELKDVFGEENVVINPASKPGRPEKLDLLSELITLKPFQFIVEAQYIANTETFRDAIGFDTLTDHYGNSLEIGSVAPDIIQTLPPRSAGPLPFEEECPEYNQSISPNGSIRNIEEHDERLRLRIIDIKLAAEPGANYFAEVVYYSMSLSAWLQENKLDDQYLVVATPAVWPGSYDVSNLSSQFHEWNRKGYKPTASDLAAGLEKDIEIAAVDAYAPRLRRLLSEGIPIILATNWDDLPYHVDFSCQGCEFLGYPWKNKGGKIENDERHCWPTAERCGHLSRVAGLSSGAASQLETRGAIANLSDLSSADHTGLAFSEHQMLRAKGMIYPHRAQALSSGVASTIPDSGGDALMPRWPDLRFYIFVDYDLSSAITVSFGLRALWSEPLPFESTLQKQRKSWTQKQGGQDVFLVDRRNKIRECEELLKFLHSIKKIMDEVTKQDDEDFQNGRRDDKTKVSSYQIYLWDEAQKRHLIRLMSRHLPSILKDPELRNLAWLFPPPELLARAEDSSRQSPITIISSVVQNTVAAPVPHHFTLLELVRTYKNPAFGAPSVHPLYREPLTDLIPSERIYEYWERIGDWNKVGDLISQTVRYKMFALGSVVSRLEADLKRLLPSSRLAAPPLNKDPKTPLKFSPQGRLWYEFTRLNASLQGLDIHMIQSMPPREREARFKSAILPKRLEGTERNKALKNLQKIYMEKPLNPNDFLIYQLSPNSTNLNARDGDIGFALSPLEEPGFLDIHPFRRLTDGTSIDTVYGGTTIADSGLTAVSIVLIDRVNQLIVLKPGIFNKLNDLELAGKINFSQKVILDPVPQEFLIKKVKITLQAIGYPSSATAEPRVLEALGETLPAKGKRKAETPASQILWNALTLNKKGVARNVAGLRKELEANNFNLNDSQWNAWNQSLTRQFILIWGPPGTGKSWTLRNIILSAISETIAEQKPLRVLITSGTYNAIDNVLFGVDEMLAKLLPNKPYSIFRLQSNLQSVPEQLDLRHPDIINLPFSTNEFPSKISGLINELKNPTCITIVTATAQQLHNLSCVGKKTPAQKDVLREWFDFVVLDEASQLDVATSTLIFTKVTTNGSVILAGDDLQLPPVHQAEAPDGLENIVGSVYNYFRRYHEIEPEPLQINYRSNREIVEFTRLAGYDPGLRSHSPDLSIRLSAPFPTSQPSNWPNSLTWTPDWSRFLNPQQPTICFIYEDELSSQVNDFEADAIASLIYLLYGQLKKDLANKLDFDGNVEPTTEDLHDEMSFWKSAIGVVTPHRAQMSKIVQRLQIIFPDHNPDLIRGAVDTVERFQGQERQIILASFGLGDPDMIQSEDEFLYSLNRFNVLASRAQAKLIVFTTRTLVDHLSNDSHVLQESRLLKRYAESFCAQELPLDLGYLRDGVLEKRSGVMKYHELGKSQQIYDRPSDRSALGLAFD